MPRRGDKSGMPCTSESDCTGRMFPIDLAHDDAHNRIVRWRECLKCGARVRTHEQPFGRTKQGPPIVEK